jgi:hypothetical protein
MRTACAFLLCLLLSTSGLAQSALTIDKLNRKDVNATAKETAYSSLIEGTIEDPDLTVYVQVLDPRNSAWRSYKAIVDKIKPDPDGRYRWRALCHFGEYDGRGIGASYQVRAIALDPQNSTRLDGSTESTLLTNTIAIKRVKR